MGKSKSELGENKSKLRGNMWELFKSEEGGEEEFSRRRKRANGEKTEWQYSVQGVALRYVDYALTGRFHSAR